MAELHEKEVEKIISSYSEKISDRKVFFAPEIPDRKLKNAIANYATGASEKALLLFDATIFGSAKEGILLTARAAYSKSPTGTPITFDWADIRSVVSLPGALAQLKFGGIPFCNLASMSTSTRTLFINLLHEIVNVHGEIDHVIAVWPLDRWLVVYGTSTLALCRSTSPKMPQASFLNTLVFPTYMASAASAGLARKRELQDLLGWSMDDVLANKSDAVRFTNPQSNPGSITFNAIGDGMFQVMHQGVPIKDLIFSGSDLASLQHHLSKLK